MKEYWISLTTEYTEDTEGSENDPQIMQMDADPSAISGTDLFWEDFRTEGGALSPPERLRKRLFPVLVFDRKEAKTQKKNARPVFVNASPESLGQFLAIEQLRRS